MDFRTSEFNPVQMPDGKVFVAGGHERNFAGSAGGLATFGNIRLPVSQVYDPKTQSWSTAPQMKYHAGSVGAVALTDGKVVVGGGEGQVVPFYRLEPNPQNNAEVYNPLTDQWTLVNGLQWHFGAVGTFLPSGEVLVSGGDRPPEPDPTFFIQTLDDGIPTNQTTIWNSVTGAVLQGRPMKTPRSGHGIATLPDGTVLAVGGFAGKRTVTSSVEVLSWGQPKTTLTLNPNFYIATANQSSGAEDGLCGLQAAFPGSTDGGMFFGGLLAAGGSDVAYATFSITEPQTVTVRADLSPLPGMLRRIDVTLRMLDGNKNPVAPAASGTGNVTWTGQLAPGFYVVELRSAADAPAASIRASVGATRLQGGVSVGGSLQSSVGVETYLGFALTEKQDATFQLFNEQTFGFGRGAGSVVLTVKDGNGTILKKLASGGINPPDAP